MANPFSVEPASEMPNSEITVFPTLEIDQQTQRIALLIPVSESFIDGSVLEKLTRAGYTPKAEFHVTALDIKAGSAAAYTFSELTDADKSSLLDSLQATQSNMWQVTLHNEYYVVEKAYEDEIEPRRSIIQIVDSLDLDNLYANLNLLTANGTKFEVPPAHITLATQGNKRGIGISTAEELQSFGSRFTIPE